MSKRKRPFNHGDKDTRRRKACERLGNNFPHCILGNPANVHALELHHVAGREFDEELVVLCNNHHAPVSDGQKDHPAKIDGCTNPLEAIGHLSLGLGELVVVAVEDIGDQPLREFLTYLRWKLQEIGVRLIEMARAAPGANAEGGS
jgi:hypothetical protein